MSRVYSDSGDIIVEGDGGRVVGSLARRPAVLLPEASWITLSGKQIIFPDFRKTTVYGYVRGVDRTGPPVGDIPMDGCLTAACIPAQEWGPDGVGDGTFTNNLPQEILATVPNGVNYLDVRVSLTRTKNPTNYLNLAVPALLAGNQVLCEGGSALVEAVGPWRRSFWIGLSGSDIVLRRYQSVNLPAAAQHPTSWVTGGIDIGWSHHGGVGSNQPNLAHIIQTKQGTHPGSTYPRGRSGADRCSLTDNSDFSSIYTGTITIMPGYIAP